MRLKVTAVEPGLHPNQLIVSVSTENGAEFLAVNKQALLENSIEIGRPVAKRERQFLIELPAETDSGA